MRRWMPHGECVSWDPLLLGVAVLADALIALSYFGISWALVSIVRRYPRFKAASVVYMGAAFIAGCAGTHVMGVLTVFFPLYWPEALVSLLSAFASVATFCVMYFRFPFLLELLPGDQGEGRHGRH